MARWLWVCGPDEVTQVLQQVNQWLAFARRTSRGRDVWQVEGIWIEPVAAAVPPSRIATTVGRGDVVSLRLAEQTGMGGRWSLCRWLPMDGATADRCVVARALAESSYHVVGQGIAAQVNPVFPEGSAPVDVHACLQQMRRQLRESVILPVYQDALSGRLQLADQWSQQRHGARGQRLSPWLH